MYATESGGNPCRRSEACALVRTIAEALMGPDPSHGWPHVSRVLGLVYDIVEAEGVTVDWDVLWNAVMLHDVGRSLEGEGHHAIKSAKFARRLLPHLGYPSGVVEAVANAILAHSYSLGAEPGSVEARVLSDADKLDALGAVGIARVFHYGCLAGRSFEESLEHIRSKILRLPELMHFEYSRRLAEARARIVERFLREIEAELSVGRPRL